MNYSTNRADDVGVSAEVPARHAGDDEAALAHEATWWEDGDLPALSSSGAHRSVFYHASGTRHVLAREAGGPVNIRRFFVWWREVWGSFQHVDEPDLLARMKVLWVQPEQRRKEGGE